MAQVVIGTAGHIDHGKTALVKALTGVDTDRLEEEKRRGMTIDLGFAFLDENITIIDVPGHERFIRNMVAGVRTIQVALLVVAADDGVMPQTKEHVNILSLLGVPRGVVALTKIDLVDDPEWLDLLELDIRDTLKGTFLETATIVRTSTQTETGIETLRQALIQAAEDVLPPEDRGFFRLPVDRAFTVKGFGLVTTGTVLSGRAQTGQELVVLPVDKVVKIRGLQTHGHEVHEVKMGDRAALNITGVDKRQVWRGSELCSPGWLTPGQRFIAQLTSLSDARWPLRNGQRIRLHCGTAEVMAQVRLFGPKVMQQGTTQTGLIHTETPVVVAMNDRFIIRSYSPLETLGGGRVLDPQPKGRGKALRDWIQHLADEDVHRLRQFVERDWRQPQSVDYWARYFQSSPEKLESYCQEAGLIVDPKHQVIYSADRLQSATKELLDHLSKFHEKNPYHRFLGSNTLRRDLGFSTSWFTIVTEALLAEDKIKAVDSGYALSKHKLQLNQPDQDLLKAIESALVKAHLQLPTTEELIKQTGADESLLEKLLYLLKSQGKALEIADGLWLHATHFNALLNQLRTHFDHQEIMKVVHFKSLTGLTRKYSIPLLEYCDRLGYTIRRGDERISGDQLRG
jgi:selenocysteine-specific elongation factor